MSADAISEAKVNAKGAGGIGFIVGLIGLILLGAFSNGSQNWMHSYVFAYSALMMGVLGCLSLTILYHMIRPSWLIPLLRFTEAGGGPWAIITSFVLYLPILAFRKQIYPWYNHPWKSTRDTWFKDMWFQDQAFLGRVVLYFLLWLLMAWVLRSWSEKQEATGDKNYQIKRGNFAAPGMVLFFIVTTIAVTDFFMALDSNWFSTMFPAWFIIGSALFAHAVGTFIVCLNARKDPYQDVISKDLTRDLGNILFTFNMVWIYFTLSQFLITWSGNLPEFIVYYSNRRGQFLSLLGAFNIVFGWFIPWTLLLAPRTKAVPKNLLSVAAWLIFMRLIDLSWNILPFFRPVFAPTDLFAIMGLLGLWIAVVGFGMSQKALLPSYDRRLQEAAHVH